MTKVIDTDTLRSMMEQHAGVRVIDVRTPGEFESVHIPGAYNVPLDTLGELAEELARRLADPAVLMCASGDRANQAQRRLAAAGFHDVSVLAGGIRQWEAAGGPLVRGRQRWSMDRQVRLVAGSIVLGSVVASIRVPSLRFVAGAVGAGLTFAALTDTCGMAKVLAKLPYNQAASCDIDAAVAALTEPAAPPTSSVA